MPQTEHLMVGIQSAPPSPQMLRLQNEGSRKSSPALSQKSHSSAKQYTAVSQQHKTANKSTKPPTKSVVVTNNKKTKKKIEKNDHFSVRWELQLSALVLICFVIGLVVPLSMIIVGSIYVFDCPQEVMIPVFLIVFGSTFLASVFGLRKLSTHKSAQSDEVPNRFIFWTVVLFQIGWFAVGCYWVYRLYEPNYNAESEEPYCNKTLYQYAFWMLNAIFIVLGVVAIAFLSSILCTMNKTPNSPAPV